jgi:ParB-like chromosome segregation protein Spo0J
MHARQLAFKDVGTLKGHLNTVRTHPAKQIGRLEQSIPQFGFTNPLLVDDNNIILAGHARWQAAKAIGLNDAAIRRGQQVTKRDAILEGTRKTFEEVSKARRRGGRAK